MVPLMVVSVVVLVVVVVVVVVVDGTGQSGSTLNKNGLTDSPDGRSIVNGSSLSSDVPFSISR